MTQTNYAMPNQRVPSDMYQQAAINNLGELVKVYKPKYSNPFAIIGVTLVVIIVDIIIMIAIYALGYIAFYLVVVPFIVIIWAFNALLHCNLRVYIFTNGFISYRGRKGGAVRWDQVQAIWEKDRQRSDRESFIYIVQRNDGKVFEQGSHLQNGRDMGIHMMREVTRVHLPLAKAAYEAGQTLSFGKVKVDMQGLNNGKEIVPWDQIGHVTSKQGVVCIEKDGRLLKWSSVKSSDVPNLPVLVALVNYVVSK